MEAPKTLQDAILYFADFENCKAFLVSLRWSDGVVKCPRCQSDKTLWIEKEHVWKCYGKHDHAKFSLKTGTVMEDSPISLDKWLAALWLVVNCKNGISSCVTYSLTLMLRAMNKPIPKAISVANAYDMAKGQCAKIVGRNQTLLGQIYFEECCKGQN